MLAVQREERYDTPMLKSVYFDGPLAGFQPDRYYYEVCTDGSVGSQARIRAGAQLSDKYADGTYKFLLMNADGSTTEQSWSRTNDTAYTDENIFGDLTTAVTGITIRCTSADGETVQDYVFRFYIHSYPVSYTHLPPRYTRWYRARTRGRAVPPRRWRRRSDF